MIQGKSFLLARIVDDVVVEITTAINPDGTPTQKPEGEGWEWIPTTYKTYEF